MNTDSWNVVQVVANHEKRVARQLAVRAVEYYLPLYVERSHWSDRTVTLQRPLFPGYVFVRYQPHTRIAVLSAPGILRLLGPDGQAVVDGIEIERIRQGLATGEILRPHSGLAVGTHVRVCRGVFQDAEGIVTELRRHCSVVIALSAVQQYFSLEADLCDVEVLSKPISGEHSAEKHRDIQRA
jgi:transcriptional antiterminator RfaH